MAREASSTHPPASRENTPSRGVALLLGGQNPKTLEYQIYLPSTSIDTLVTGMAIRAPSELTTIAAQGKMSGSSPWIFGLGEATSKEAKEGKGVLPVGISQDLHWK